MIPRGWLDDRPQLAAYVRAARTASLGDLSFHWVERGRKWFQVDLAVGSLGGQTEPDVEVSVTEVAPPYDLTVRELEVLTLVAAGLTNPGIADRLGTTRRTVATHIEHLLTKLDAPTRTAAAALALSARLVLLPLPGGPDGLARIGVQRLEEAVLGRAESRSHHGLAGTVVRQQPLLVGGIYPLHGSAAADGVGRRKATQMAIAEINSSGGIAGRPVVHVPVESDVVDRASLTTAIGALVERQVDAITFGYTLARDDFAAALAKAADYGCPVLHSATSAAAHKTVLDEPDRFGNVFQVCAPESRYGPGFVRFLDELSVSGRWSPPNRRLLVVDSSDPHLTTFTSEAAALADRSGWQTTLVEVDFVRPDWAPVLARLSEEPAAIMVAIWMEDGLRDFLRAFRATGLPSLVYAIYAPSVPGFVRRAGSLADGLLWATVIGLYADTLGGGFAQRFSATQHSDPGRSGAALHYDMVHLLSQAWRQAPNPRDHAAVTERMRHLVHRGVSGAYYFGTAGQSALTFPDDTPDPSLAQAHLVHQIQDGRHVIVAPAPYRQGAVRPPAWLPREALRSWG